MFQASADRPDYVGLVRHLLEPLLEPGESLRLDCEVTQAGQRVLLRLAAADTSMPRILGRGGRNLQAVRAILSATAELAGQQIHLEVLGQARHTERPQRRDRDPVE
ncbi:KH domain-containing protein [Synechococcus elongatus]|uniref:KH domain-containing protein n=1 Tax=Synechococcus elongatus PCC 11802 TaxID=2283154 RepID=A0AAT9K196_SYNEL|nr:KH domain-containing protein [Synechococcus elongatus]QFZ91840.1 KH domain-containing protein [Synechococcus elongatus PCC 11802]